MNRELMTPLETIIIATLPFVAIIAIAAIDALNKGRMMATVGWDDLPAFWRDRGVLAWRSVLALLVIAMCVGLWLVGGWRPVAALLVMAGCGVESCLYWWLLRPFGINQPVWWRVTLFTQPGGPDGPEEHFEEMDYATWFDYPPEAPWLRVLPPFWFGTITRVRVYATAWTGVLIAVWVMVL